MTEYKQLVANGSFFPYWFVHRTLEAANISPERLS